MSTSASDVAIASVAPLRAPAGRKPKRVEALAQEGIVYLSLRYGLALLISVANMLVLTWWLGPHVYGVFVTAVTITTFLSSLSRFGIDTYLVRCESAPKDNDYNVAFTVVLGISVALALVGAAVVPALTYWYSNTELVLPYLVLLLSIPLIGAAGPPLARLERELSFRTVAGIELAGQFTFCLTTVVLCACGLRLWAPLIGFLSWQGIALAGAFASTGFRPHFRFEATVARAMLRFGFGYSASIRTWQLRTLVNPLLVGRFAGTEAVAFVALAIRIAEALGFVRTAAGRLGIAALARLQQDSARFRSALTRAQELQVITLGPLLGVAVICSPWIVPQILGARWLPAIVVLPFVGAGVLINSIFNLQASALFALGKEWAVTRSYTLHLVLLAGTAVVLVPKLGISGYGWAELVACAAYVVIARALSQCIAIPYGKTLVLTGVFASAMLLPAFPASKAFAVVTSVLLVLVALAYAGWPSLTASPAFKQWLTSSPRLRHILMFTAKTRQRGLSYATAVVRYQLHALGYRYHRSTVASSPDLDCCDPRFHFSPESIPRIVASVPDHLKSAVIAEADRILQHRFQFRGTEVQLGERIDWQTRPNGNLSWQWDLNRHAFFLRLGTTYYYTADPAYIRELVNLWEQWIAANPSGTPNWKHPFEVAARLQNWMWAYFLVAYSQQVSREQLRKFTAAMQQHAAYVAAHLEYHWPNNHLLLEAKALYEFGMIFSADCCKQWRAVATRVLQREITSQILRDGVHAELSSMYHRIVAGELSELVCLCDAVGQRLPPDLETRIQRMLEFSRALVRPDGSTPLFGDSAERDTYIRFDATSSDLDYWLPPDRRTERQSLAPGPSQLFPEAGYAFLRSEDRTVELAFDCGPFSRCAAPNHGHCDALSFELYCHGSPVIIDPGVYLPWNDSQGWAKHFRSTAAHNTLVIDGQEQSELSEFCDVRRTAQVRILTSSTAPGQPSITAECIPYWSVGREVCHRRRITLHDGRHMHIRDEVTGSGAHRLDWSFQFAPNVEVNPASNFGLQIQTETATLRFSTQSPGLQHATLELFRGCYAPFCGWVSRNSAEVLPATAAVLSMEVELPMLAEFTLEIIPRT